MARGMLTLDELRPKVESGEVDTVILAFADHYGRLHGKRFDVGFFVDEICEGGTFEVAQVSSEGPDPISQLVEAGLIGLETGPVGESGMTRRVWLGRTGKASAAAVVLPLVATIVTPRLALGQVPGPSLEEELTGLEQPSVPEPLLDSPQIEKEKRRSSETSAATTGTRAMDEAPGRVNG